MRKQHSWHLVYLLPLIGFAASGHHSAVMFDTQRQLTVTGTVREFQFNNPHCFIQLLVSGADVTEWSIEMGAPAHLLRNGWTPRIVRPGDKLTVTFHPLRNGNPGGNFLSALDAAGRRVGGKP